MNKLLAPVALVCALAFAGCSTPDSRIERNQAAFSRFPPAVQANIRAGQIGIGYTTEMVQMALGRPDRIHRRQSAEGETEVWVYADKTPRIGIGFGVGSVGHHSGGGVAVGTSTGGNRGDRMQVHFRGGRVTAIDRMDR